MTTITATTDVGFEPPRNVIDLDLPAGSIMQTVAVYRIQGGARELVRAQPVPGFDARTVYDYEAPYGVPVSYSWESTYIDPTSLTTVWTEAWASLASWTVTNGSTGGAWSVSGGKVLWTGPADPLAKIARALTPGQYQFAFANVPSGVGVIDFGGFSIDVTRSLIITPSETVAFDAGTTTWVISMSDDGVSITTSGGTFSAASAGLLASTVTLQAPAPVPTFSAKWGSSGSGSSQFNDARAIARDSTGAVYVVDTTNKRVQKFTAAGVFSLAFGTAGSGNGQFGTAGPTSIAINASDEVWVTDPTNKRVQRFNTSGVYQAKFGTAGTGDGQLSGAAAIAIDSAGFIYIYDKDPTAAVGSFQRIQKFTSVGVYVTKWGAAGVGNGEMRNVQSMAFDSANNLYVADYQNGRVQKFAPGATSSDPHTYAAKWTTNGAAGSGLFALTLSVATDNVGRVWVTGTPATGTTTTVRVYSTAGVFLFAWGAPGTADGEFSAPWGIMLTNPGKVYVVDFLGDRVQVFDQITAAVDDITASTYGGLADIAETSAEITLDPAQAWIVHPASPGLSVPIGFDDLDFTTFDEIGQIRQASTSTVHPILGQSKPIAVTPGARGSDELTVSITVETAIDEVGMRAVLADQVPLLFRIPPAWDLGFVDGFYSIGDVSIARVLQEYGIPARVFSLPLTSVDSPDVDQDNAGWSWATLAAEFPTWDAVFAAFESWSDVLVNRRRPGF